MGCSIVNKQQGFNLIEIMLSLTLGIILTGSVLKLMLDNREASNVSEYIAMAQQNGRFALYLLSKGLRKAGYRNSITAPVADRFYLGNCEGTAVCTIDGTGTNSDRIAIVYTPPASDSVDCTRTAVPTNQLTADVYYIDADPTNNNVLTLFCTGYDPITQTKRSNSTPIIAGIEQLQVVYGVMGAGGSVDQYVTANNVTDWMQVHSVRIGLLVSGGFATNAFDLRTRTYQVLHNGVSSFTDRIPRYVYSTAIKLNNTGLP